MATTGFFLTGNIRIRAYKGIKDGLKLFLRMLSLNEKYYEFTSIKNCDII